MTLDLVILISMVLAVSLLQTSTGYGFSIKLIVTEDGKTVESEISTFEGDNTCITTMQLV